ncbi:hypothetical protein G3T14_14055 [Methylobacterium sp. BTF04]|uniref:hypothetical protein n=1 Tax=Methylobacterium sp. BTF04 TaxID=2708300 RepID=UPI0013CF82DC|nr:hypothetical protein [Methylobacterium sp. BTF04]NEU13248.1 hypothetical protein [Methylobacterium sp. BTF04]
MTRLIPLAATAGLLALVAAGQARAAESCDALTATVIRATGASLAGRAGAGAVFRAADAERMSLDCRAPRRMVFGSLDREPSRAFFALIGQAARALTGADPDAVEVLALTLHQASLLADAPRQGVVDRAALRCETGPRDDSLAGTLTLCVLVPARPRAARRRIGLFAGAVAR